MKHKIGILCSCFIIMSYLAVSPVIANIADEFSDVGVSTVQMILTLPSLVCLSTSLLAGVLARYLYKRSIILISMACYMMGGLCPLLINSSIFPLLICSAIMGLGVGGMVTTTGAIICDCYEGTGRSQMMGFQSAVIGLGGTAFTLLGGWLSRFGWRAAYGAFFLLVPCFFIAVLCLPKGTLDTSGASQNGRHIPRYVRVMALLGFFFFTLQNTFNTNISFYMAETGLGTARTASLATSLYTFAGLLAGCLLPLLMKRLAQYTVSLSFLLGATGLFLAWLGGSLAVILLGALLIGFGFAMFTPASSCLAAERVDGAGYSACLALTSACNNLGGALSPVIVNPVSGWFGPSVRMKFLVTSVSLLAVSAAAGAWLGRERR